MGEYLNKKKTLKIEEKKLVYDCNLDGWMQGIFLISHTHKTLHLLVSVNITA